MFTRAFLMASVAEYFQPIKPFLSKLKTFYDSILEVIFNLDIFYDEQEKRHVSIPDLSSTIFYVVVVIGTLLMTSITTFYGGLSIIFVLSGCVLLAVISIFIIIAIVDIIAHYTPYYVIEMIMNNINIERAKKEEVSKFNEIFGFFPPNFDDEIYDIKISSSQKEVNAKLTILNDLRQKAFSEQEMIREKIATFSQQEFAKNPEDNLELAKSLTAEKQKIDALTAKCKSDYDRALGLALNFRYLVPGTKKRP